MGNELRKDYFSNWVMISKDRGFRPKNFEEIEKRKKGINPFKPGNEKLTPPESDRVDRMGKWLMRSFPNKFSFSTSGQVHEVIVETNDENKKLWDFTQRQVFDLFVFYQKRFRQAVKQGYAFLFKNEGAKAGASIPHAHAQLVTTEEKPGIAVLEKEVLNFGLIKKKEKDFIIKEDDLFYAYCPKASRFKLEAWIVCKRRGSSLSDLTVEELDSASKLLLSLLKKLNKKMGNVSYNIIHHEEPNYHMHLIPRIGTMAGMELGMNVFINSIPPEDAVRFYK